MYPGRRSIRKVEEHGLTEVPGACNDGRRCGIVTSRYPEVYALLVYRVMRAIMREVHGILRRMNVQYVELTNYITKQHGRY